MSALKFSVNYSTLAPKDSSVTALKKFFNRAGSNVITIDVDPAIKTSSGIKYKELQFSFTDSQQVVFQVKATGDIFKVKLNGKDVPIKHQDDEAKAVIEIINAMDAGRAKFQANQAKTVIKPPVMKTSVVSIEQQLTEQRDELKAQIAQVKADIVTAQSEQAAKAKNDVVTLTGKELGDFPDTEEGKKALRSAAKDYLNSLKEDTIYAKALNNDVSFRTQGIKKTISLSGDGKKLQAVSAIKYIIKNGKKLHSKPPYLNESGVVAYHTLRTEIAIGEDKLAARVVIKEDIDGLFHYDHSIHEQDAVLDSTNEKGLTNSPIHDTNYKSDDIAVPSRMAGNRPYSLQRGTESILSNALDSVNSRMVLNLFIEGEEPEYVEDEEGDPTGDAAEVDSDEVLQDENKDSDDLEQFAKQAIAQTLNDNPDATAKDHAIGISSIASDNRIMQLAGKALSDKTAKGWLDYAPVESYVGEKIGENLSGYVHVIYADAIRHMIKEHGNEKSEAKRGQVAITLDDIAKIPTIVSKADKVEKGDIKFGK